MRCSNCGNENRGALQGARCAYCGHVLTGDSISGPGGGLGSVEQVIRYAKKATVKIVSMSREDDKVKFSSGTGFFVKYRDKRFLLTNFHVVEDAIGSFGKAVYINAPQVDPSQNKYDLKVLTYDMVNDIAVCKVNYPRPQELNFLEIIDNPAGLEEGNEVITVGNPRELMFSATTGRISSLNYPVDMAMNKILVNIDTDNGNSGGAAVRVRDCKVVGITSANFKCTVNLKSLNANTAVIGELMRAFADGEDVKKILRDVCGDKFNEDAWESVTVDNKLPGQCICTSGEAIAMLLNDYIDEQ